MRTCIVTVCIAALLCMGLGNDEQDIEKKIHEECQTDPKTHIEPELLVKYKKGEEVDKAVIGPHLLCMYKKFDLIGDDGKINQATLKKALEHRITDEEKRNKVLEQCSQDKATPEETVLAMSKCYKWSTYK